MPPPVEDMSDEETGDIPFKDAKDVSEDKEDENQDDGDEGDEDDEDEEGLYVVERITQHEFLPNGDLRLLVKWKGYEDIADLTWEPEENLKEGANEVLTEYYKQLGGRPKKPAAKPGPGRKRKSMSETTSTPVPATATEPKRRRKSAKAEDTPAETEAEVDESEWVPKGKSWEKELNSVDTIIRDQDDGGLYAFLLWNNGKRSRVSIESCYEKCPMKMLKFYENHLVFKDG